MNDKPNYSKGNRREIIYLILNLGLLPYPTIKMLSTSAGAHNRTKQTAHAMLTEDVLEKRKLQSRYGSTFLVLKDFSANESTLAQYIDKECVSYYNNIHKPRLYETWGKSNASGMRKICDAYISALMYGAGLDTFPDQNKGRNKYFNSREIKKFLNYSDTVTYQEGKKKISFTKGYGIAITEGGNYLSYMTWHNTMPSLTDGEHKLKNMSFEIVNKLKVNELPIEGLVVFNKLTGLLPYMVEGASTADHNRLVNILNVYKTLYVLPYDEYGRKHLELMTKPLWKENLIHNALGELQDTRNINYSCHHYDKATGTGTLLFCIPDIAMLNSFTISASIANNRKKFRIICFDYQKEFVKALAGNTCEIYTTPFDEYYNSIN